LGERELDREAILRSLDESYQLKRNLLFEPNWQTEWRKIKQFAEDIHPNSGEVRGVRARYRDRRVGEL